MKVYAQFQQKIEEIEQGIQNLPLPPDQNRLLNLRFKTATDVSLFISQLLQYALTIAGLVLLAMIIAAGFTIMTAGGDPKKTEAGKNQLTTALIGFFIVFAVFWIAQILQVIFNIPILSG